jgi:hypothetical protein
MTAEEKIDAESHNPKVGGSNPPPATNLNTFQNPINIR